ncbi:hypothetical protein [Yoonia sp. 2307UL14-13]|uniref:hypothetical protein n=1 Tax=Yoonia sp. 2307UL14-13 TaxID=3126506 RepID=UPI00309ED1F3
MKKEDLNLIELSPDLIAQNHAIMTGKDFAAPRQQVSGVVHRGHCAVWASIGQGAKGWIDVSFEMSVPSVTAEAFAQLRQALVSVLRKDVREKDIAMQAGLLPDPPPNPQSRMARYAACLYADLFFGGAIAEDGENPFDANDGQRATETQAVFAVRAARIAVVELSGTLHVEATLEGDQTQVYVPVTVVEYDDGVMIPFAGYAETALVDTGTALSQVTMAADLWV